MLGTLPSLFPLLSPPPRRRRGEGDDSGETAPVEEAFSPFWGGFFWRCPFPPAPRGRMLSLPNKPRRDLAAARTLNLPSLRPALAEGDRRRAVTTASA